tara:strand:+ start:906 stop:1520 length:615 start_codon:yes stop_codon:yes gene_type:complete
MTTELNQTAIDQMSKFDGPIPGESFTADPDNPKPHMLPPEHTSVKTAIPDLFIFLTQEENFINIVLSLDNDVPVADLASIILFTGFQEGKWNPDLMLLLLEPTMFMIMALAERAEMGDDYILYRGEEKDDVDPEEEIKNLDKLSSSFDKFKVEKISEESVPAEIREKLENLKVPSSLLNRTTQQEELPEEPPTPAEPQSLLTPQ